MKLDMNPSVFVLVLALLPASACGETEEFFGAEKEIPRTSPTQTLLGLDAGISIPAGVSFSVNGIIEVKGIRLLLGLRTTYIYEEVDNHEYDRMGGWLSTHYEEWETRNNQLWQRQVSVSLSYVLDFAPSKENIDILGYIGPGFCQTWVRINNEYSYTNSEFPGKNWTTRKRGTYSNPFFIPLEMGFLFNFYLHDKFAINLKAGFTYTMIGAEHRSFSAAIDWIGYVCAGLTVRV